MGAEPFDQWVKFQHSHQNWYPKILITLSYEVSFLSTIVLNEIKSFFCFIPNTDQSSGNINHWQLSNHQRVAFTKYKFQTFMTTQNYKQIKNTKNQQKHIIEIPFYAENWSDQRRLSFLLDLLQQRPFKFSTKTLWSFKLAPPKLQSLLVLLRNESRKK